jgi:biopolymer transport protein ExbB/TolQ
MAEGTGLKLDGTISLGHLMAAIPAITIAFSILWWVVGYTSRIEANSKRIEELQAEVRNSIKELKDDQLKSLQSQLSSLPDLKAHMAGAEKNIDEIRAMNQAQSDKIEDARRMAGQAVDILKQIYQPEIPVRRTR